MTTVASKIAAVSGATSGIGRATVALLASHGWRVVACGRRESRLSELEPRESIRGFVGDVTQANFVQAMHAFCRHEFGDIPDAFVLSAGQGLAGTVLSSDRTKWRELIEVNYLAMLAQLRDCAETFVARNASDAETAGVASVRDIVVIGSIIGREISAKNPVYGSTKFATHSVVEALRREICQKWIRVTLIEPGYVRSEFQRIAGYDAQWFDSLERDLGPFLTPDDIARSIAFVLEQPDHVHVDDIRIRPTRQTL